MTKLAPFWSAALLAASSRSPFSEIGISNAFFLIGVRQVTSPYPRCGASCTGSVCSRLLARAIATACAAARAMPSFVTSFVAANPQVPLAITRIPQPNDSVLVMPWILVSRAVMNWFR